MKRNEVEHSAGEKKVRAICAGLARRLHLLLLLLLVPGCCTAMTVDAAMHGKRSDRVRKIERATLLSNNTLVLLVQGLAAEKHHVKPYTFRIPLGAEKNAILTLNREKMTAGWDLSAFERNDSVPVEIGRIIDVPKNDCTSEFLRHGVATANPAKTVYLLRRDGKSELYYQSDAGHPSRDYIWLNERDVATPERYPLLLLVPVAAGVDAPTLPVQIFYYFVWRGGGC